MKQGSISSKSSRYTKKFYIHNLGCAKNQVDAEIIVSSLTASGWVKSDEADDADIIIVNTCGFIKPAKEESIETTISFREHYPNKKIIMTGCLAERYGETLKENLPEVDAFFGNKAPFRITEIADEVFDGGRPVLFPDSEEKLFYRKELFSFPGSAYVKISEGCSHRCAFCAIPLIRGGLRSRGIPDIIADIESLLKTGVYEINLIAQDLAAFGRDRGGDNLPGLLRKILQIENDFRIRLLYIHPDNFPMDILDICAADKRVFPYFDLPFQHASKRVLSGMGRKGDSETYLRLIETIRKRLPDAVIRSTFLIGFPGERNKDFEELLDFVRKARIDWAGSFIYSMEEDTPAFSYRGRTADRFFQGRFAKRRDMLEKIQQEISSERMERFVGKELMVLVEEAVKGEAVFFGRAYLQAPEVDGLIVIHGTGFKPGDRAVFRISKRNGIDLEAFPLKEQS